MEMAQAARDWTVEDHGELLVTPAPSLDHQEAIARLYLLLAPYVAAQGCGHVVFAPAEVVFSPRRGVQPDLFVLPLVDGRRPKRFADAGRLLLAVEVVSPSAARADRLKKRSMYRAERVDEYWVVDLDARLFERSTPADDRVEIIADRLEWRPEGAAEALAIDVERYFSEVFGT